MTGQLVTNPPGRPGCMGTLDDLFGLSPWVLRHVILSSESILQSVPSGSVWGVSCHAISFKSGIKCVSAAFLQRLRYPTWPWDAADGWGRSSASIWFFFSPSPPQKSFISLKDPLRNRCGRSAPKQGDREPKTKAEKCYERVFFCFFLKATMWLRRWGHAGTRKHTKAARVSACRQHSGRNPPQSERSSRPSHNNMDCRLLHHMHHTCHYYWQQHPHLLH